MRAAHTCMRRERPGATLCEHRRTRWRRSMAKLKNRKRERFALEIAAMTPLEQAYVDAGYKSSPWAKYNASKLAHDPDVAARIEELQGEFSQRSAIKAEYIQHQLLPLVEANTKDLFENVA